MKKKILTVLFAAVVAVSSILGGCGASRETGGRAEGTEQTRESGERRETGSAADNAENPDSAGEPDVSEPLEADKSERLVRPDSLELDYWIEWEYDGSGNQTKGVAYDNDGIVYCWSEYEYDKSGNITKGTEYDPDGSVRGWIECEYDKSGNLTKETGYDPDGSVGGWVEYEYDKSGNITKGTKYDPDGELWEELEYDKSGNVTKAVSYDSRGEISDLREYKYEYDKSGNMTKVAAYDSGGSVWDWVEYEYDESYNLTKEIHYQPAGPKMVQIDPEDLTIPQEIPSQNGMPGYSNLALFTVGTVEEKELYQGEDTGSIIIISINMDTGDTRLVSVCRDTYLNLGTDSYGKCNEAYAGGGGEQAVRMLNRNFDMNIGDFMSISYTGLIKIIDGLGGVYIDVDTEDLENINNMQSDIAGAVYGDLENYTPVETAGNQILNGLQATAYFFCDEDAYHSATKQREVYKAIGEQMKKQESAALTQLFDSTIEDIYTSIDRYDLLEIIGRIADFQVIDDEDFPQKEMSEQIDTGSSGMSLVPIDLETNVIWLHRFLFDDEDYVTTQEVKEISDRIKTETN